MEYAGFHNQDICTSATQMSSPANVSVFPIVIHKTEQNVRICKKWNIKYLGKKCNYQHLKKITATFLKGCLLGADWKELFHSYFLLHRCFLRLHHLPTAVRRWLWESWPFAGPKGRLNPWCCSHRNSCFLVQIWTYQALFPGQRCPHGMRMQGISASGQGHSHTAPDLTHLNLWTMTSAKDHNTVSVPHSSLSLVQEVLSVFSLGPPFSLCSGLSCWVFYCFPSPCTSFLSLFHICDNIQKSKR